MIENVTQQIASLRENAEEVKDLMGQAQDSFDYEFKDASLQLGIDVIQVLMDTLSRIVAESVALLIEQKGSVSDEDTTT